MPEIREQLDPALLNKIMDMDKKSKPLATTTGGKGKMVTIHDYKVKQQPISTPLPKSHTK